MNHRRRAALAGHASVGDELHVLLVDHDPRVRELALGAFARQGELTEKQLDEASRDPAPSVRRRAAELLAAGPQSGADAGSRFAVDALIGLLGDPDRGVVEAAAWALGERSDTNDESVTALASTAEEHDDPFCREAAVAALGAIGDPAGLTTILAATQSTPAIRRRAVIGLASFEGPEVDEALRTARKDRDWQVRQAAEDLS